MMKENLGIKLFAFIEIIIGSVTLAALIFSLIQGHSTKPWEVFIFVLTTSLVSVGLGLGILKYNPHCYYLLLYFSSIIVLSKLLIFAKIVTLSGALETTVPAPIKNTVSIFYHSLVIFYFTRKPVRERFKKN